MLDDLQKRTAQAIVNIFETGHVLGEYGKVTLLPGDPGHLTYGRSQTTLTSGNLALLLHDYCTQQDALLRDSLSPFLPRVDDQDLSLDHDRGFHALLREAGEDPVMWRVQDGFFERVYWRPAEKAAQKQAITTALGAAVVYDGCIHGSWPLMRDRTIQRHDSVEALGETTWIARYVEVRRDWLANHSIRILRNTVYRMDAFNALLAAEKWSLGLPIVVRSIVIDRDSLDPAMRVSAQVAEVRILMRRSPFMKGDDVRLLQQALVDAGFVLDVDGVFGGDTEAAVRAFQQRQNLTADGKVGAATRAALGID